MNRILFSEYITRYQFFLKKLKIKLILRKIGTMNLETGHIYVFQTIRKILIR